MSYDLTMLQLRPGQSHEDALARLEEETLKRESARSNSPEAAQSLVAAAKKLVETLPSGFVISGSPEDDSLCVEEGDDGRWGLQVMLGLDHSLLTLPYWHKGEDAKAAIALLEAAATTLEASLGQKPYDGQIERIVNWKVDRERVFSTYSSVVPAMQRAIPAPATPKRRWWQFWK